MFYSLLDELGPSEQSSTGNREKQETRFEGSFSPHGERTKEWDRMCWYQSISLSELAQTRAVLRRYKKSGNI